MSVVKSLALLICAVNQFLLWIISAHKVILIVNW